MHRLLESIRHGCRLLARSPLFTAIAALTLALGIGANSAMFSVISAVLLNPFPYPDADRIIFLGETQGPQSGAGAVTYPDFLDWREQNRCFEHLGIARNQTLNLTGKEEPVRLNGAVVSADIFPMLGVAPLLGRAFSAAEDRVGSEPVVVLSHGLWQRRFGGDPQILSQSLLLDGRRHAVVGVMPARFTFWGADAWVPAGQNYDGDIHSSRVARMGYFAVGRLRQEATLEQARTEMTTIAARLAKAYPESNTGVGVELTRLKENVVRGIRPALWILMAAVASVLLIACANVANLLLVKAGARQREMAIRQALGASRMRIVMQTVGESLPLAALGGGLGLLLSLAATKALVALVPPGSIPSEAVIRTDFRVLLFTGALALVTAIFFSVLPAIQISGTQPGQCLHEESRTATGGAQQHRVRQGLIVAEIALALTLLAGAGLLLKSLRQMANVELGFRPDHVLHMQLTLSEARYPQRDQPGQFYTQVLEGLRQIPGVKAVGANATLPFCGNNFGMPIVPEGRSYANLQELPGTSYNLVMGDYFKAMGIAVKAGRAFTAQDTRHSEPVAIINESLASRYFGVKDPIGKRVMLGLPDNLNRDGIFGPKRLDFPWHTIVGVVADVKQYDFGAPAGPQAYLPMEQAPDFAGFRTTMMPVMLTEGDPALLSGAARTVVRGLDRDLPIARLDPLSALVRNAMERPRFAMTLLGVFAVLALVLACVGIYGVVSYGVEQRRRELGVRLALGAEQSAIVGLVLRQSLRTVGVGLAVGLAGILILNRFLESILFQVSATDPTTVVLTCGLLATVALVASVIPAWKAAQTDPARVLHCE